MKANYLKSFLLPVLIIILTSGAIQSQGSDDIKCILYCHLNLEIPGCDCSLTDVAVGPSPDDSDQSISGIIKMLASELITSFNSQSQSLKEINKLEKQLQEIKSVKNSFDMNVTQNKIKGELMQANYEYKSATDKIAFINGCINTLLLQNFSKNSLKTTQTNKMQE